MRREEESWAFKESKRVQRLPEREGKGDKMDLLIRETREMTTEERENRERLKSVLTQIREEIEGIKLEAKAKEENGRWKKNR